MGENENTNKANENNENLENAFDKLSEMLSSEDGQKQISDIISMLSGGGEHESKPPKPTTDEGFGSSFNPDLLKNAASLLSSGALGGGKKDKNTAFLEALKPFLKKERREKLDSAVKIISAASLFKELGGFKKGGD